MPLNKEIKTMDDRILTIQEVEKIGIKPIHFQCDKCNIHILALPMRIWKNGDYLEPETECPLCNQTLYIKKWQ